MNTKKFGPKTITPDLKLQYIILVSWSLELKTSERIKETNPNMVFGSVVLVCQVRPAENCSGEDTVGGGRHSSTGRALAGSVELA